MILSLTLSMLGNLIGGIVGIRVKDISKKTIKIMMILSATLMFYVVCYDLIPETIENIKLMDSIICVNVGIIVMYIIKENISVLIKRKKVDYSKEKNEILIIGISITIGMILHNFPEGFAIGSGLESSNELGRKLAIAICIHDIPEGIVMSLPLKMGEVKNKMIIFLIIIAGVITMIGVVCGKIFNQIYSGFIGKSLGFAGGAMLYIIFMELLRKK